MESMHEHKSSKNFGLSSLTKLLVPISLSGLSFYYRHSCPSDEPFWSHVVTAAHVDSCRSFLMVLKKKKTAEGSLSISILLLKQGYLTKYLYTSIDHKKPEIEKFLQPKMSCRVVAVSREIKQDGQDLRIFKK